MSKKSKTIAEKRAELDQLLAWFESDEFMIEEAVDKFKEAEKIATEVETELLDYKNNITVLKQQFDKE